MDKESLCRLEIMVASALGAGSSNGGEHSQICHFEFVFTDRDNQRNEVLIVGSCRGVCMHVCVCVCVYRYIYIHTYIYIYI
jgi:hypothetical protein